MNWLHYLLEANLYLAVFYLGYSLLLSRETYYTLNRVYLLFSCIAAFILPVLQLGILKPVEQPISAINYTFTVQPAAYTPIRVIPGAAPVFTWDNALIGVYMLGVIILLAVLLIKLYSLFKLTRQQNLEENGKYKLVYIDGSGTAFSFFNYLFIGTQLQGSETVIRHELVHIRQKHSADIIFIELLKIFNWFNPFIYLLQYSLKTIHEYIADEKTAIAENDAIGYSSFLVNNAYGLGGSSITHSFFNYNLLKKRIVMLHQKRSGNLARLKYLVAVPICGGLLCASTLAFSKDYGWVDIAPPANPTSTAANADKTAANRVGYVINPSSLSDQTLNSFADKLRSKGYKMLFKKYNDRDNGGNLIDISLQSLYSEPDGKVITGSATFRINELKKTGYLIFVGADKDRHLVFVHSDTKNLAMQKEIYAYHLGPHRTDKTNTGPQVIEPNKELLVHQNGKSIITDKFSDKLPDGTTHVYTAYNLSNKNKVDLSKRGIEVSVLENVKLEITGNDTTKNHIAPPPPPAPPVARVKFPLPKPLPYKTPKGYSYSEGVYTENGKQDIVVTFHEKDGKHRSYDKNKATDADIAMLKDKYGYIFPAHIKMPPPPPAPSVGAPVSKMPPPPAPAPAPPVSAADRRPPPPPPFESEYKVLLDYLNQNVKYPAAAIANHTAGTGIVQYTLGADHKISNVSILKSTNPLFDKEVESKIESFKDPIEKDPGTYTLGYRFSIAGETNNAEAREGDYKMSQTANYTAEISIVGNAN